MELVADILLAAGALGAGLYCFVLARRLKRFNDLEKGVGGAVAVLSSQVDTLSRTLAAAQAASGSSNAALDELTRNAEAVAKRLELMMAAMHDVPPPDPAPTRADADETQTKPVEAPKPTGAPGVMFMRHDRSATGGI